MGNSCFDRETRIKVFENTMKLCKENPSLQDAIRYSVENQRIISEEETVGYFVMHKYDVPAEIVVSTKRSFEAALSYADEKVGVLNFASASNPGGGVKNGSNAQEECLCRCSTLYPCLNRKEAWNSFYGKHREQLITGQLTALYNDDCIYTPGVVVFKTDTSVPAMMPENDWRKVDVITCAAPNLRSKPENRMNPGGGQNSVKISNQELQELHTKRARKVLQIAAFNETDVLILGAFGCGAFQNPPEVVSMGMLEALKEYQYCFKKVEFAVYCPPNDLSNFKVFQRVFDMKI